MPQVQSVHAGPNGALAAVSDQGDVVAWSADPASIPKLVWPMRRAAWRVRNLSLGLWPRPSPAPLSALPTPPLRPPSLRSRRAGLPVATHVPSGRALGVDQFAVATASGQVYVAQTAIHLTPSSAPLSTYKRVPTLHRVRKVRAP